MRLPNSAQTSQPWRIHELVRDFRLEDVWALPTPGGPDDFPRLVELLTSFDPATSASPVVRALFAIRWKMGELLGWDEPHAAGETLPFVPLYATDREWAGEIANRTVHGVIHVGWVPDGDGGWRGQLSVYVKRNGLLGAAYMVAITPFRHLLVYPPMLAELGRRWQAV
jgi:hypothetical protein